MDCPSPRAYELPSIFALMSWAMLAWIIAVCLFYFCLMGVRELSMRQVSASEDTVDCDGLPALQCQTCFMEMLDGHECQLTPEEEAVADEALAAHAEACGETVDRMMNFARAHPYGSDYRKRTAAEYLRKSK